MADVVAELRRRLRGCAANWVVGGSVAAVMHGVDLVPDDIDLETDADGAAELSALLSGEVVRPVRYSTAGTVRSHFGVHRLGTITVEVIGDLEILRPDGRWTPPIDIPRVRTWVGFRGEPLPVLSMTGLWRRYVDLDRPIRAAMLRTFLECSDERGGAV